MTLEKKVKIVLLANDMVGFEVAKYLAKKKEDIVALIVERGQNAKKADDIAKTVKIKNIFYADQLTDPHYLKKIQDLQPDLAISGWFSHILKKTFIDIFPKGVMNLHNSYLPYNRGKYPHVWAIYEGSKYGVSIHFVNEKIDAGDIIARKELKINITDTADSVYNRSLKDIVKLFIKTWTKIKAEKIKPKKQNSKKGSFHLAKEVTKLDFIDFNKKYLAKNLINQLRSRSFRDRTYAYFLYKGKRIYVKISLSNKSKFN